MRLTFFLSLIAAFSTIACSSGGSGSGGGASSDFFCSTVTSYPNGVTISGNGDYEYRTDGNGAIAAPKPIRNAEVSIYSGTSVVQCGTTDDNGAFSLKVPQSSSPLSIRITSRMSSTVSTVYVLNNPTNRTAHYISTTFTPDASKNIGTLRALANGDLKGGAFNILDKIYAANLYMRNETVNCSTAFAVCTPFVGAPKVSVFWDKGVNPGDYFSAGPISFYIPGERELYILGGDQGDVDSSDADHFDDSVIIHEYGHFIEDTFADSDSPGGSHSGDTILDPRLAWGEGWANFFQAAVFNDPVYRDTSGNSDGVTSVLFNEDLETPDNDVASTIGEGNFREFSISRLLWDALDPANEGVADDVSGTFAEIWTVFANPTNGFKSTSQHFRNVGLFHSIQQALPGATNWNSIRVAEKHRGSEQDYARGTTLGGACGAVTIQAASISGSQIENGTSGNSNQFASNDFYKVYHAGGAFNLQLSYTTTNPSADIDLYLYKEDYRFGNSTKEAGKSTADIAAATTSATETINLSSLAAGYYMINVRVDTGVRLGNSADYTMTLGGQNLCPN
jgi:hypothetical protein